MYARTISMELKAGVTGEFSRIIENDVLPLLSKHDGFRDQLTFITQNGKQALVISIWDDQEQADAYSSSTHPWVLKAFEECISSETPEVRSYEVSHSTLHDIAFPEPA